MSLQAILMGNRDAIVDRWFQAVLESYPADAAGLFNRTGDPFRNPVGHTLHKGIGDLFDALVGEGSAEALRPILDEIVRVRAVQDFAPSEALAFVFQLKRVFRLVLESRPESEGLAAEAADFDRRIDGTALLAFDVYMERKERIQEIRTREIKRRSAVLWERFERTWAAEEGEADGAGPAEGMREGNGL